MPKKIKLAKKKSVKKISKKKSVKKVITKKKSAKKVTAKKKIVKKVNKKKVVKKVAKKKVTKKKVVKTKKDTAKLKKEKKIDNVIENAKIEKELYKDIPIKYRRRLRDVTRVCKEKGFVPSDVLVEKINVESCDDTKPFWDCIYKVLSHNCIDIFNTKGLLREISAATDSEFPELQPSTYDTIQTYLRDISRYKLLSAKEEQELGEKIFALNRIKEGKSKIADPKKRNMIVEEGLRSRHRLATSNLKLVVSIAKNYTNRSRDLSLLDLAQEGTYGLYKAVDKFDYSRGYKFSTYATHWIKQSITRALANDSRTIRIPVHMSETITRYNKLLIRLEQDLGRVPTAQEIATEMSVDIDKINLIKRVNHDVKQLDTPISNSGDSGDGTSYADTLADETEETPDITTSKNILKEQINEILSELSPKERKIIERRNGMHDGIQHTLEEIGREFSVTRERVRQIEAKALEKLRTANNLKKLKNY